MEINKPPPGKSAKNISLHLSNVRIWLIIFSE